MATDRISRRALVPGLAGSATAALAGALTLTPARAGAQRGRRRFRATAGPCGLWPGHTLAFQFFLPAGPGGSDQPSHFRLVLQALDGSEIVTHDFQLRPGTGTEVTLERLADGTLRFNGEPLGEVRASLVVIAIIAILIGLLLPAVQDVRAAASPAPTVRATATSFVPGRAPGEQNVDYILPYVEQDNL